MAADESDVVRQDLLTALALVASGTLIAVAAIDVSFWWAGGTVAAGASVLEALADRSRYGTWLVVGATVAAGLGFLWSTWSSGVPVGAVPWFNAGLGVGFGANRLLFGVVRPVPAPRVARQREGGV